MAGSLVGFLMVGGGGSSEVERAVREAQRAAALDLLDVWQQVEEIAHIVVATDDAEWATTLPVLRSVDLDVQPESVATPFHFGRRLADLIRRYRPDRLLYSGGASAPLMRLAEWRQVASQLQSSAYRLVVTNNVHSGDWLGWTDALEALPFLSQETSDNALPWLLAERGGWRVHALPPSASSRFDLDTPADLLIVHHHPNIGPHLRAFLDGLGWDASRLNGLLEVMSREGSSLAVIGRVSSAAWGALERATRCWIRVFAEERGMRASGRQARGEVRSLLSDWVELAGVEGMVERLAGLVDGMLWDNRVLLAARGLWPSAADRFYADLGCWEMITEPFLRTLTRVVVETGRPIVIGGHSVVAGGLMALVEGLERRERRLFSG